jgi:hypothetical protein
LVGNLLKGLNKPGVGELQLMCDGLALIGKIPPGPLQKIGEALPAIVLGMKGIAMVRGIGTAVAGLSGLSRLKLGGLGGAAAGEAGAIGLGRGVVPVFVTNKGFGAGGPGGVGGAAGRGASLAEEGAAGAAAARGALTDRLLGRLGGLGAGIALGGMVPFGDRGNEVRSLAAGGPPGTKVFDPNTPRGQKIIAAAEVERTAAAMAKLGVSEKMVAQAGKGNAKAQAEVSTALGNARDKVKALQDAQRKDFANKDKYTAYKKQIDDLTGAYNTVKGAVDKATAAHGQETSALVASKLAAAKYDNALRTLPKQVQTAITSPGAVQSFGDVKQLAHQYDLTPKQVRTVVQLSGVSTAAAQARAYANQMAALNGRVATTYLRQVTEHVIAGGGRPTVVKADGGRVVGPGSATSDSISARLSNGEYVVKASAVKRYGVGLFDMLNAERFADGGPVKKKKPLTPEQKRHAELMKKHAGLMKHLGQARHTLGHTNSLIGNATDFGSAFAGNVFGAGLATTKDVTVPGKVFTTIINGQQVTESTPATTKTVDLSSQQILKEMLDYQRSQRAQAQGLLTDVKRLRKMGVSKSLLAQMQASGAQGVAQIHALASGSRAQVQQFNRLNAQTTTSLNAAGAYAAANESMAALQRQKSNEEATVRAIKRGLHGVSVEIKHNHLRVN